MWDEIKQQHLNELQRKQVESGLSAEERQELDYLFSELEQEEWAMLNPAIKQMREEQQHLQMSYGRLNAENALLSAIVERQEDLLNRAKVALAGLLGEHKAIQSAYERIRSQSS